jgi:hypothetical protein
MVKSISLRPQTTELSMDHSPQFHFTPPATLLSMTVGAMIGRKPSG